MHRVVAVWRDKVVHYAMEDDHLSEAGLYICRSILELQPELALLAHDLLVGAPTFGSIMPVAHGYLSTTKSGSGRVGSGRSFGPAGPVLSAGWVGRVGRSTHVLLGALAPTHSHSQHNAHSPAVKHEPFSCEGVYEWHLPLRPGRLHKHGRAQAQGSSRPNAALCPAQRYPVA